ncbi:MAG: hypothetical protein GW847_03165 [Zetaproteobacteria bacterium]|nr:hypothetical protein [Zetaproteobacteria bacterium]
MKTLELNQMELVIGQGDVLTDKSSCEGLSSGLDGVAMIFGISSWWTGAGAGIALGVSLSAYALSAYCKTL